MGEGRGFRASRWEINKHLAFGRHAWPCSDVSLGYPGAPVGIPVVPGHSQAQRTGRSGVARPRGLPLVQRAGGFSEGGRGRWQPGRWVAGLYEVRVDPSLSRTASSHGAKGQPSGLGMGPSFAASWLVTRDKQHSTPSPSEVVTWGRLATRGQMRGWRTSPWHGSGTPAEPVPLPATPASGTDTPARPAAPWARPLP